MVSESLTRMKLRQCSERWPSVTWWLARWSPRLPWKVQEDRRWRDMATEGDCGRLVELCKMTRASQGHYPRRGSRLATKNTLLEQSRS